MNNSKEERFGNKVMHDHVICREWQGKFKPKMIKVKSKT